MNSQISLARRLTRTLIVGTSLLWLVAIIFATVMLRDKVNTAFDETMRQGALRILPLAVHEFGEALGEDEPEEMAFVEGLAKQGSNFNYYILDQRGNIVLFSGDRPALVPAQDIRPGFFDLDGARAFALMDDQTGFGIVVRERAGIRDTIWRDSIVSMLLPLIALLPILALIVAWSVRRGMQPLQRLGEAVSQRHRKHLTPLELGPQPDELTPITDEINNLLKRLAAALETERNFAAESAHELRTPIAGALAHLQLLSSKLADKEQQENLSQSMGALAHLARLAENLLQLSRLDAGFATSQDLVHLNPVVDLVLRESPFANIRDQIEYISEPQYAKITLDAFAIIIRNLLQNAVQYRDPNSPIVLQLENGSIQVRNSCPVVPEETLTKLTDRYVRGQTQIGKGSGLGLAIVSGIAQDVGATLVVSSPAPGAETGFSATVKF